LAAYAEVALADGFDISPEARRSLVTSEDPVKVVTLLRGLYARQARRAA
jgi:hypothetical protein